MEGLLLGVAAAALVLLIVLLIVKRSSSDSSTSTTSQPTSDKPQENTSAEEYPAGKLNIYFGSQTGTAEGFSQTIAEEAKRKGFDAHVIDLEDFEIRELVNDKLAIFLMATYGEGEPTDNALEFVRWLKKYDGEEGSIEGMNFSVFGLGNTQYEHYNEIGKITEKRLTALGAKRFYDMGLGDDDASIEEDFDSWREKMMEALVKQFHPNAAQQAGVEEEAPVEIHELPFTLVYLNNGSEPKRTRAMSDDITTTARHFWKSHDAKVTVNRELRKPADGGSTVHVELDISDADMDYQTADNLAVLPLNNMEAVEKLASVMGYDLDALIKLEPKSSNFKHPFPSPTTVRHALQAYCDLHDIPRKSLVKELIPFARDPKERATLSTITSKAGKAEFHKTVDDAKRSLLDLLTTDFISLKIPLEHFISLCPRLQPRYYTISSSSLAHPKSIHVTVAVINDAKPDGGVHKGVCSTYLANLVPNGDLVEGKGSCKVFVRDSSFRLPKDRSTPVILVGPGTGIAPMRAILQERAELMKRGEKLGECVLYFGCKRSDQDFIYQDELEGYEKSGVLSKLEVAFSRQGSQKVYVQHLMEKASSYLWDLIDSQGAYIYVCGGTAMGADVNAVVTRITSTVGGKSEAEGKQYITELKSNGRYVQELWAQSAGTY